MEYINNKQKLEKFKATNNYFAIIDFDRTLTTAQSDASMGIIPKFLGGKCLEERMKVYNYYRPLELDYTINDKEKRKLMKEWANNSFALISKYLTSEDIINNALIDANLHLRTGAKEFLEDMYNKNIPVIIMSAGVGNLIKEFLQKQGALFDNIILVTNFFKFENNKACIDMKKIIASSNKDYSKVPEEIRKELDKKDSILLCGDIVEDINMIKKDELYKTLTVGFLDYNIDINLDIYNKNFDIVLANGGNFNKLKDILNNG